MVGYSALSQRNEALALELLEEHRQLLRARFPKHQGQEIKTTGGFLKGPSFFGSSGKYLSGNKW